MVVSEGNNGNHEADEGARLKVASKNKEQCTKIWTQI